MIKRGFEIVNKYQDKGLNLPIRATKHAAGYDFESAVDMELPTIWSHIFEAVKQKLKGEEITVENAKIKPSLVPTGIKAYMGDDEFLQIANRSSNPLKRFLVLPNGVGVIDADYYNNVENEGEIYIQLINVGIRPYTIKKGDRIGQGIFLPFLKADQDKEGAERSGGFGSSGD